MALLFAVALFLSVLLLFWVQPLAGKMVLPILGGTPAVWNTCMLFFQGMLLAGYAYVLASTRWLSSRAGSLVALISFPLLLEPSLTLGQQSRAWSLAYLALAALVLACAIVALRTRGETTHDDAQGSTDERTTAEASDKRTTAEVSSGALSFRRRARWVLLAFVPSSLVLGVTTYITTDVVAVPLLWVVPLSLYLLSFVMVFARRTLLSRRLMARVLPGAAVLLALVYLSGATQPAWFLILFHLLFLFAAAMVCHGQLADDRPDARHLAEFYLWLSLGGALGGLFNAVLAPLLFNSVVEYPLAILLASYLRPPFRRARGQLLGLRLGARGGGAGKIEDESGAVMDESGAVEVEPRADWLDVLLPLCVSALPAVLALVVPHLEMKTVERVAVSLGVPLFLLNYFFAPRPLRFAVGLGACMLASAVFSASSGKTLSAERNFFGTVRVIEESSGGAHWLRHGSTLHGRQFTDPARACEPLSYYHREGPLGSIFAAFNSKRGAAQSVAVVGLGAGTSAAYSRAGQEWTFYEIDPAVVRVAREPKLFTYLSSCAAAPVSVVLRDARLRLRDAPADSYGLILLDAFSSDAVPAHLLTREALALYLSKLAPGGIVAFHVSNRSLELERVVGGIAADAGLVARIFNDNQNEGDKERNEEIGKDPSTWVVVARSEADLGALSSDARWQPLDTRSRKLVLWRDDFSNVVSLFKWL